MPGKHNAGGCGCCGGCECTLSGATSGDDVLLTWTTDGEDLGSVEITDSLGNVISTDESGTDVLVPGGKCREYTLSMTCSSGTVTKVCIYTNTEEPSSTDECQCAEPDDLVLHVCPQIQVTISGTATEVPGMTGCEPTSYHCYDFSGTYNLNCGDEITICARRKLCFNAGVGLWVSGRSLMRLRYIGEGRCSGPGILAVRFSWNRENVGTTEPPDEDEFPAICGTGGGGGVVFCKDWSFDAILMADATRCNKTIYLCPSSPTLTLDGSPVLCGGGGSYGCDYTGVSISATFL
jgi:hypothetical protein